ncbi:MAG: isoprenyl transferase [Oscillospiraceae bacterium]|nr:isoprenyl transferase [Oscillospiraceae bacterium]
MFLFRRRKASIPDVLPVHIGIIMDGNGRWAKKRALPRQVGHRYGAQTFRTITKHCEKRGIKYLTVYAFSTENWKRPASEVNAIMELFKEYLHESLTDFTKENIRTRFIGDFSPFTPEICDLMRQAEELTKDKTGLCLNIAINYGGREEITQAARRLAKEVKQGDLSPEDINDEQIAARLYTAGMPDPDLILRPSGEFRTSNFLLWQSAYAEYLYMDVLWPDFKPADLDRALEEYARRNRRFGGL